MAVVQTFEVGNYVQKCAINFTIIMIV